MSEGSCYGAGMAAASRSRLRPLGALIGALLGVAFNVAWPLALGLLLLALGLLLLRR